MTVIERWRATITAGFLLSVQLSYPQCNAHCFELSTINFHASQSGTGVFILPLIGINNGKFNGNNYGKCETFACILVSFTVKLPYNIPRGLIR